MVHASIPTFSNLRERSDPTPAERLNLGQALLVIKQQRLYQRYGFDRFESFLDSQECPFGHTVCRHAMRLAEREDLHSALELGIGRLTELMRLKPDLATQVLQEGTPGGPVAAISVRALRRHVAQLRGTSGGRMYPVASGGVLNLEQMGTCLSGWNESSRQQLLDLLLKQHFGHSLAKLQVILQPGKARQEATDSLAPFCPDTRCAPPQRWVALTTHLEGLEQAVGGDMSLIIPSVRRLNKPLEAWEKAVFYLDLCRREPGRAQRFARISSVTGAVEQILLGRDWHYNTDQAYLSAQLANLRKQRRSSALRPFWRRLFSEVNPPEDYRSFLGQLEAQVEGCEWQFTCVDSYQADYTLKCLRHRSTRLFWQIAADYLQVHSVRLSWQEGSCRREQVVVLERADVA